MLFFNHQSCEAPLETIDRNLKDMDIRPKDINDLVKDAQNVYKWVFEQVYLVMLYVRQLCNHKRDIAGRMELIDIIHTKYLEHQKELEGIQWEILQMLEDDCGSNDIILYLQDLKDKESDEELNNKIESILNGIQHRHVVFSPNKTKIYYNYYTMYVCYQYPIEIFQKILSKDIMVKEYAKQKIFERIGRSVGSLSYQLNVVNMNLDDEQRKLESKNSEYYYQLKDKEDFAQIIKDFLGVDKDSLLQDVRLDITQDLGAWASDIFAKISNPLYKDNENSHYKYKNYNDNIAITENKNDIVINLDRIPVENLYKMNQLDDLMVSIKSALNSKFKAKFEQSKTRLFVNEIEVNNKTALEGLSTWYDRYSTNILKKIDQIPKLIVAIIEFDLDKKSPSLKKFKIDISILENFISKNQSKRDSSSRISPVRNKNKEITYIVSISLFLNSFTKRSSDDLGFNYLINNIKQNNIDNLIPYKLGVLNNEIMLPWTIFQKNKDGSMSADFNDDEQDKMMYRFKKIPIFFKDNSHYDIASLNKMILNQFDTKNSKPFPYNSSFPWPLWIRKSHKQNEKQPVSLNKAVSTGGR